MLKDRRLYWCDVIHTKDLKENIFGRTLDSPGFFAIAPSWLDRPLYRYRRGHGFESRSGPGARFSKDLVNTGPGIYRYVTEPFCSIPFKLSLNWTTRSRNWFSASSSQSYWSFNLSIYSRDFFGLAVLKSNSDWLVKLPAFVCVGNVQSNGKSPD